MAGNPWQLYEDLVEGIPAGIRVRDVAASRWTVVVTDVGTGIAMSYHYGPREGTKAMTTLGQDLRTVASWSRSWDMSVATIGVAALNSWYNTVERVAAHPRGVFTGGVSTFDLRREELAGCRVGMVGHFPEARRMGEVADLKVLERTPSGRDLPDQAAEYELADRDWVFLTGTTLVNKTLPRLLELTRHTRVTLIGPTTTFAPEVFGDRIGEYGGSLVTDRELVVLACKTGCGHRQAREGLMRFNVALPDGVAGADHLRGPRQAAGAASTPVAPPAAGTRTAPVQG